MTEVGVVSATDACLPLELFFLTGLPCQATIEKKYLVRLQLYMPKQVYIHEDLSFSEETGKWGVVR